jgi:hypothetical protein
MTVRGAFAVAATLVPLILGGTPSPAPTPSGSASPQRTVVVSTSDELVDALDDAKAGDTIALGDGSYTGRFVAAAEGSDESPITLTGARAAVLSTGSYSSGFALHITGSHWIVDGISVTKSGKGIVLDGSEHTTIRDVEVGGIGAEGVHFRAGSSDGILEESDIHDTGVRQPAFGEGVYIGSSYKNWRTVTGSSARPDRSDRVVVRDNVISTTTGEGVDAKEGTTGGSITGNTFRRAGFSGKNSADSWIDVKGNGYTVSGNSGSDALLDAIQVHTVREGWGKKNVFSDNTVLGDVAGFTVWVDKKSVGTTVECHDAKADTDGEKGLSNLDCTG